MALVSTQKLPNYSTSIREKLTLPKNVAVNIPKFFPSELQNVGKAELLFFLDGPNEGRPPFVVTASLQKLRTNGKNGVRVVLLESGWKPIARELKLKKGDTVSIFLLNNMAWTYLIRVQRTSETDRIDVAMDEVVLEEAPRRMQFDLNEPAQPDMEINWNQPNQPVRMEFDLNEPAYSYMEINLNE